MKILFLDLSTHSTGWAVADQGGELLDYGCIQSDDKDLIKRIKIMSDGLLKVSERHPEIKKIVAEEVRADYKNAIVYKALNWCQGICLFRLYEKIPDIQFEFIQPSSWRSKIGIKTGRGVKRAEVKKADIAYVQEKYGIKVNDDMADAICIKDSYFVTNKNEKDCAW